MLPLHLHKIFSGSALTSDGCPLRKHTVPLGEFLTSPKVARAFPPPSVNSPFPVKTIFIVYDSMSLYLYLSMSLYLSRSSLIFHQALKPSYQIILEGSSFLSSVLCIKQVFFKMVAKSKLSDWLNTLHVAMLSTT